MPFRHYCIAFLCVFATSFARKSQNEWENNDWTLSNTMSKENGEYHDTFRVSDTIDIDNNQGRSVDNSRIAEWAGGSGSRPQYDQWGSGYDDTELSFEDDDYGSGLRPSKPATKCEKIRESIRRQPLEGAFLPRCTADGEYQAKQCDPHSRQCWCVDKWGQEMAFTRGSNVKDSDCLNRGGPEPPYRPNKPGAGPPDKNQPDRNKGYDYQPNPEETDDGVVYDPPKTNDPGSDFEIKETDGDAEEPPATPTPGNEMDLHRTSIIGTPGLLPGIIGGAVVGLLCAVLLVMFIVYRMRKKDEGSYALEEPKMTSPSRGYTRAPTKEYWA